MVTMAEQTISTLAPVGALLRSNATAFRDRVHEMLYARVLQSRQIFPMNASRSHLELAPALAWVLERTPIDGEIPQDVLARIRRLGMDHRRHGFPTSTYGQFAEMLVIALRELGEQSELDPELIDAAADAFRAVGTAMTATAYTADLAGLPAASAAQVVEVERRTRHLSIVRLTSSTPIEYNAGQYLPVTSSYLPAIWRHVTPANPSSEYGTLELHIEVATNGSASHLLATPHVGDLWIFGQPRGDLTLSLERPATIIAHRTGLAAAESLLFDAIRTKGPRPRVHLIVVAPSPGQLYDMPRLERLSKFTPWLTVTPVATSGEDPWWLSSHVSHETNPQVGDPASVIKKTAGPHDYLVIGPTGDVVDTVHSLYDIGVEPADIWMQPYSNLSTWPEL